MWPPGIMAVNALDDDARRPSLIWVIRGHHVSALAGQGRGAGGLVFTLIALATGALWGRDVGHLVGMGPAPEPRS